MNGDARHPLERMADDIELARLGIRLEAPTADEDYARLGEIARELRELAAS